MSNKTEIEEYVGTNYSQLVKGSAIAVISRAIEKTGLNVEFKSVKNISDPTEYGKGIDKTLMRKPSLIQDVINSEGSENQKDMENLLKKEIEKTVICLYRPSTMVRRPYDKNSDRSKPQIDTTDVKGILGYVYAQLEQEQDEIIWSDTPQFEDLFIGSSKIFDKIYPVQDNGMLPYDQEKEDAGYKMCEVLKDYVNVEFSVEFGFLVASEKLLHRLQFLLLKNLYENEGGIEQSTVIEYESLSKEIKSKVYDSCSYIPADLSALETLGDSNSSKLYGLNVTIESIKARLYSDYTIFNPIDPDKHLPTSINLQIGIKPKQ